MGKSIHPMEGADPQADASLHRLDEFPSGYSLAGCSPAVPASASPEKRSMSEFLVAGREVVLCPSKRYARLQRIVTHETFRGNPLAHCRIFLKLTEARDSA